MIACLRMGWHQLRLTCQLAAGLMRVVSIAQRAAYRLHAVLPGGRASFRNDIARNLSNRAEEAVSGQTDSRTWPNCTVRPLAGLALDFRINPRTTQRLALYNSALKACLCRHNFLRRLRLGLSGRRSSSAPTSVGYFPQQLLSQYGAQEPICYSQLALLSWADRSNWESPRCMWNFRWLSPKIFRRSAIPTYNGCLRICGYV